MCELFQLSDLRRRFPGATLQRPELLSFDLVIIVDSRTRTHWVDLEPVTIGPHQVLHLTRGQLHQWPDDTEADATLLLTPSTPAGASTWTPAAAPRSIPDDQWPLLKTTLQMLRTELASARNPLARRTSLTALRDLVFVVADLVEGDPGMSTASLFNLFRDDLEQHLVARQSISMRAARLGYSAKTLDRACRTQSSLTAKQFVDQRLVLEARRLLALNQYSISQIAQILGFDEPTNFTKFIRRRTGQTPTSYVERAGPGSA